MKRTLFSLAAVVVMAGLVSTLAFAGDKEKHKDKHAAAVSVGAPAPQFSLEDQNGKIVNLADYKDKIVVLEWFNEDCPICAHHYKTGQMQATAEQLIGKGVVWLSINSTKNKSNADNKSIAGEWKMNFPILNDSTGVTGHAYGARTTPHMYVINKGVVAYMGAIDDDPNLKSPTKNYVVKAVDEIMAGQSVSEPETKPYGCSVKYAK